MTDGQANALATSLMLFNESRGEHSWGYADSVGVTRKGLGTISANVRAGDLAVYDSVIVHTRYKTQGAILLENAHPFTFGPITGAHNGCLWNHHELNKDHNREFDVDSMHIFAHIAEDKPLFELVGYGAIEYVDTRCPGTIFLGTFESGELAVARVRGIGVVWSSDRDALKRALAIANLKIENVYKIKAQHLYALRGGRLSDTGIVLDVQDWYGGREKAKTKEITTDFCQAGLDDDFTDAQLADELEYNQLVEQERQYSTDTQSLADYYREQERALRPERTKLVEDVSKRNGGSRTYYLQEGR